MAYIAHQDAVETLEEVFPGGTVQDNVRSWGWVVWMDLWKFQVRISSLGGTVEVKLEEKLPIGRKEATGDRLAVSDIQTPEDLRRAVKKCREILLGIGISIFLFCGLEPPPKTPLSTPEG